MDHSRTKKAMKLHFTERRVADAAPGEYVDDEVKYLRLYVSESGSRSWGIYKWIAEKGYAVRRSIGLAGPGEMTVDAARAAARSAYDRLKSGESAKPEKSITLKDALTSYTDKLKTEKKKQAKWAEEIFTRKKGGVDYSDWLKKPLSAITQEMLEKRQAEIVSTRGQGAATRALKAIRAVYAHAIKKAKYKGENIGKAIDLVESPARTRVLSADELGRVLEALNSPELMPYVRPFFRLLMLTGVRWGNLCAANWKDIDLEAAEWVIPAEESKSGHAMHIQLIPDAVALFQEQRKRHPESDWVFPSPKASQTGHLVEPSFAWARVREIAKLKKHATLHDLRRTFGSQLLSAGESMALVAAALGHRDPAITAKHYAFMEREAVRAGIKRALG
ncbi:MAG: site-specific integrase [Proteobacteria bacterium]|nr:site-specific integrase [Pseudomonadota bacterium]